MIIALVRHGETDWNRQHRWQGRSDIVLNELGRRQAAAAADHLDRQQWHWMISSPLRRAYETAMIIANRLPQMPTATDDRLVEQHYGDADGMINSEAAERWPDGRFPGMETREELRIRGAAALREIAAARSGDGVLVAHGGLIRATVDELCGIECPRILNGALTLLRRDEDGWRALEVNLIGEIADADAGPTDPAALTVRERS